MKSKNGKILLSFVTLLFSFAASGIGVGLVGDTDWAFGLKVICNSCFTMPPLLTIQMIIALFRKNEK